MKNEEAAYLLSDILSWAKIADVKDIKRNPITTHAAIWSERMWLWPQLVIDNVLHYALYVALKWPSGLALMRIPNVIVFRHCCHRSTEPRSPGRKRKASVADREWLRKPEAKHCACPRNRRLLRHSPLWSSQRSIWGWSQPVWWRGLCRFWVSEIIMC